MYNWEDVLIIGDSFCADREKAFHWPQLLVTNLTNIPFKSRHYPRGKGFSGGSWWSYRKLLLQELKIKIPKVLIVCHTEPYRIPNDKDLGINFRSVETKLIDVDHRERKMPDDLHSAAFQYYKHLMSFEFYNWANDQWFKEIDEILTRHNIEKVIHFYGFVGEYNDHTFSKGVTVGIPLSTYAEEPETYFFNLKKASGNHYTPNGNKAFATSLTHLINNYPGDKVRLDIKMVDYGSH